MFLHWESNDRVTDLGVIDTKRCNSCEQVRPWKLLLRYRYSRIWYFISWVSYKQYVKICGGCSTGLKLDSKEIESKLGKNPIAIEKRLGWIMLSLLAVFLAGMLISSATTDSPGDPPGIPFHQVLKQKAGRSN